jgi:carbon monoxide dehydrogenase subunit G
MKFQEQFVLKCPQTEAWAFLSDFPRPIEVMPGVVEVVQLGPHRYQGAARVHIGPFSFLFHGQMNITLVDHRDYRVNIDGQAADKLLGGHFHAQAFTQTLAIDANRTRVTLEVVVGLGGLLGKLGQLVLRPKARQVVQAYALAVAEAIGQGRSVAASR